MLNYILRALYNKRYMGDLKAMNLISPQLQAFMAVVEKKTVHAAADLLHLTQTAITQRIRGLETHLKTTLFLRSRRGMELTREGEALLRYCQTVKILEGETIAKIVGSGLTTEVEIRIAGPSSIMRSRIIPALLDFPKKFPNVLLHFIFNDVESSQQQLKAGECDFAILPNTHVAQEMSSKALKSERYKLVCAASWQKRSLKEILQSERIIDFNPSDNMTLNYLQHFNLLPTAQKSRHFVNNIDSMAALVEAGIGYTTLTEEFASTHIHAKKMIVLNNNKSYEHYPALVWYPRAEMPSYFSDLVKRIK